MEKENYEIMSADTVVAVWQDKTLTVYHEALLPLYLRRVHNADLWLQTRAIDSHRANSRLLKKALRLAEKDDLSTVIHVHGATITDNYWIRPIGSNLVYNDVRFGDDFFSNLALTGSYDSFAKAANSKHQKTPELTNIGSFEKCWKLQDGTWWMYKKANHKEMFSELFICKLGQALGMNMAEYVRGDGYVKSPDFTHGAAVNFEPASAFMGDNEEYVDVVKALKEICPEAVPDYIRMIFLDTITANPDRHTNNFGLLRDTESGQLLGLAPNFDNNLALIARGYPSKPKTGDLLISLFCDLMNKYPEYRCYMPSVSEEMVRNCIKELHMKVRVEEIVALVMTRYSYVKLEI